MFYNESASSGGLAYMIRLTEKAVGKVQEIIDGQEPKPAGLRIAVVGGGCSGFSYSMAFETRPTCSTRPIVSTG